MKLLCGPTWECWEIPGSTVLYVCTHRLHLLWWLLQAAWVWFCVATGFLWLGNFSKTLINVSWTLANWQAFSLASVGFCVVLEMVWSWVVFLLVDAKHWDRLARYCVFLTCRLQLRRFSPGLNVSSDPGGPPEENWHQVLVTLLLMAPPHWGKVFFMCCTLSLTPAQDGLSH